jgi:putative transposase
MKLDYYTKKLTTESFLKLLLFAQLEEIESLHALSDCLFDDQLQKGVDLNSISISQLSRRLNGINPDLFQKLFLDLVAKIHAKTHYTKRVMPLKIIDSSTLPLNLTNHKWAEFRKTKAGVKLHLRLVFMEKGLSYLENKIWQKTTPTWPLEYNFQRKVLKFIYGLTPLRTYYFFQLHFVP